MIGPSIVLFVCCAVLWCAYVLLKTVSQICDRIDLMLDREERVLRKSADSGVK